MREEKRKRADLDGDGFAIVGAAEDGAEGAAADDITQLEAREGDAGGRQCAFAQRAPVALPAVHRRRAYSPRRHRLCLPRLALRKHSTHQTST